MIKTLSAALLAVSMLAAPALAAGTETAPIAKPAATAAKVTAKALPTDARAAVSVKPQAKTNPLDAKAHLVRHHRRHIRHHHRFHQRIGSAPGIHHVAKVTIRHAAPASRRG